MYVCMYVCVYVCMCVRVFVCSCVRTCVYVLFRKDDTWYNCRWWTMCRGTSWTPQRWYTLSSYCVFIYSITYICIYTLYIDILQNHDNVPECSRRFRSKLLSSKSLQLYSNICCIVVIRWLHSVSDWLLCRCRGWKALKIRYDEVYSKDQEVLPKEDHTLKSLSNMDSFLIWHEYITKRRRCSKWC